MRVMRKTPDITPVGFNPPGDARLSVEAMTVHELCQRAPAEHFNKLQRADFFRLIGVQAGHSSPMVDFSSCALLPGHWLLVRPGQVFRYDFSQTWDGWLLVFPSESLRPAGRLRGADEWDLLRHVEDLACVSSLDPTQHRWMTQTLQHMQADGALPVDVALRNELLRLQLAGLLLRLSMWQRPREVGDPAGRGEQAQFRRFRHLLEADFAAQHQVQHYARAMGMSDKTLSRVCVAVAGMPAKAVINARVLLEAKRLLAHTAMPVQAVASELGFDEATNFVKFFRKAGGTTPLAFRNQA